jgi:choline-sulfatase
VDLSSQNSYRFTGCNGIPRMLMKDQITRRDFLKLAGALPLTVAASQFINSLDAQPSQPNVILIVFDAFSAYNTSLYGYERKTTPTLSRLAERAVVYHNHYAGGNFTTPGTASLLTGTLPWTHRAFDLYGLVDKPFVEKNVFAAFQNYYRLAYTHNPVANTLLEQLSGKMDDHVPLADLLLTNDEFITALFGKDENTATVGWTRAVKSKEDGYAYSLFLSRILQALRERSISNLHSQFPGGIPQIAGENYFLLEDAIDWFDNMVRNLSQPFMSYFHLMPPHGPYNTRKDFFGRFHDDGYKPVNKPLDLFFKEQSDSFELLLKKRTNYDEFILYVDHEFGRLMETLESNRLLDNTWVILTSDHGELFERGIAGHLTPVLYQPVIRVPLVIFEPGRTTRQDVYSNTSTVDVLPTLLHITGQKPADWSEGTLLPPFSTAQDAERSIYVLQARKNAKYGPITEATTALIKGQYKLMDFIGYSELGAQGERTELYDIKNDPEELNDLSTAKRETTTELLNELKQKLAEVNQPYQK